MQRHQTTKGSWALLLIAVTMAAQTVFGLGAALAAAQSDDAAYRDVFGLPLDDLLRRYPKATRLPDGSYELEPGMRLAPPRGGPTGEVGATEDPSGCPDGWFCAYQHENFEGWGIQWVWCDRINLGYPYRNSISSMHNAQNGARAYFWDRDAAPAAQGSLGPNSWWQYMSRNPAPGGGNWNDRIDQIDPC